MSNFKVGQEIICINSDFGSYPIKPLKKGSTYIIKAIQNCACGLLEFNVGILTIAGCRCGDCGVVTDDTIWWFRSERFVPIDYTTNKQVTFKEINEDVPVFSN